MIESKEDEQTNDTLFGVRRSVRYHDRRIAHYERLHRLTSVTTILLAGVIFMELSGANSPTWIKWLAAVGALLGAGELVVGFARHADLHRDLKRRFVRLEIQMLKSPDNTEAECMRLEIEADEPPIYSALDLLCHNELCAAQGADRKYLAKLTPWQSITANWLKWPDIGCQ